MPSRSKDIAALRFWWRHTSYGPKFF